MKRCVCSYSIISDLQLQNDRHSWTRLEKRVRFGKDEQRGKNEQQWGSQLTKSMNLLASQEGSGGGVLGTLDRGIGRPSPYSQNHTRSSRCYFGVEIRKAGPNAHYLTVLIKRSNNTRSFARNLSMPIMLPVDITPLRPSSSIFMTYSTMPGGQTNTSASHGVSVAYLYRLSIRELISCWI